jgi:hypothetical protein
MGCNPAQLYVSTENGYRAPTDLMTNSMTIGIFAGIVVSYLGWGRLCQLALSYNLKRSTLRQLRR